MSDAAANLVGSAWSLSDKFKLPVSAERYQKEQCLNMLCPLTIIGISVCNNYCSTVKLKPGRIC